MRRVLAIVVAAATVALAVLALATGFGSGSGSNGDSNGATGSAAATTTTAPAPVAPPTSPTTTVALRPAVRTLVLYDTTGEWASIGATDALLSANLLGRFGPVDRLAVGEYTAGTAARYGGVVYVGTTAGEPVPAAFLDDVVRTTAPVVWAGANIGLLSERLATAGYGFTTGAADGRAHGVVRYQGVDLDRQGDADQVVPITITDPAVAKALGTIVAADGSEAPWAVRARNLTYVAEPPYNYVTERDRYLAWSDVLIGAIQPDTLERHRALVRLEDVSPVSDPAKLRQSLDVLISRGIPFTMAVYPEYRDPQGAHGKAYGSKGVPPLRLTDRPEVAAVIRYGLRHGGTVVSHGLTHQYGSVANPYDGSSGADFEFYRTHVDAATDDVVMDGPVPEDGVEWAAGRLRKARELLQDAGIPLDQVVMFEVPHYTASEATYQAIGEVYRGLNGDRPPTRFDRGWYVPTGAPGAAPIAPVGQFFPYPVVDTQGELIVPENLGNVVEVGQNNNTPRPPADIVENARRAMVVRDNVAGFFFHPYLGPDGLAEIVDGMTDLGYQFVPSTSVDAGWTP